MSRAALLTFGLVCSEAPSIATAQDVIDDFQTNFNTNLKPLFDTEVAINQPSIRLGDGSTTPFVATAGGSPNVGSNTGTMVNPQAAVLMKKTTGVGGRHARGRTYVPFCIDNTLISENGTLAGALVSSFNTQFALFLAQLVADLSPMAITNKTFNVPNPPHFVTHITATFLVASMSCEPIVATQRRRLGRA